jgi:polyadenylate-binding protein
MGALNYTALRGRPIRIMWVQRDPSARRSAVGNVFVKNLAPSVDTKQLAETFATFGRVVSARVVMDDATGVSKGYGFVQFESDAAARKAIEDADGLEVEGKPIYVGPFQRSAERKKECVASGSAGGGGRPLRPRWRRRRREW